MSQINLMILALCQFPRYGGEIRRIFLDAGIEISEGTLYKALHSLYKRDWLSYHWKIEGTPPTKFYSLTKDGRVAFIRLTGTYAEMISALSLIKKTMTQP